MPGTKDDKQSQTVKNNLNDKQSKTYIVFLSFNDRNTAAYFDSFEVQYIPQDVLSKVKDKSVTYSIRRIQTDASTMCGCCCIAFKENMKTGKPLLDNSLSFSND